jgi:hypothetical protein
MDAAGDEAGEMRHVDHEIGADRVGDLAESAEVNDARIGRAAGDDHFGPMLFGEPLDLLHVDEVIVAAHAVGHDLEPAARHVDRRAVSEMAAGGEVQPHEGVAGLHQRHEHFGIGGGAGMRLHIGEGTAEQPGHPLDRQPLGDIDELAAAVIALPRQAFGVLVGQHGPLCFEHGAADEVLRRDQLDLIALAAEFKGDDIGDLRIAVGQRGGKQAFVRRLGALGYRHASCLAEMGRCPQVIHPAPASYQPMSARHGIFQRITPLHLGIEGQT